MQGARTRTARRPARTAVFAVLALAVSLVTAAPAAQAAPRQGFASTSASGYSAARGVCTLDGDDVGCAEHGDWVRYDRMRFGSGVTSSVRITLSVTRANAGMPVEIRTGSATGPVIGSFVTAVGRGPAATVTVPIRPTTGTKTIVLRFPGARPTGPIDRFVFHKDPSRRVVKADFFGMHIEQPTLQKWPTVPFATVRAWDGYPSVSWDSVHIGPGRFDWTNLDRWVDDAVAHHQQIDYVFGRTPAWASTDPTGDCEGAPLGSCTVPSAKAWTEYVTAITNRYKGRVEYWELWNEPDAADFWRGSPAQLAELARIAYPIIERAGGTVLTPSPQGMNGPAWMDEYLAAGGGASADVNAFHAYVDAAPETMNRLVSDYRVLYRKYGIAGRPIWDTEHSWGEADSPFGANQDERSAWLARFQLLSFNAGIARSFWYGWEYSDWGTLFDKTTQKVLEPGIAYGQVHRWMVGAYMAPCTRSGTVYRCRLYRSNGYEAIAAWATTGTASVHVPARFTTYRTVDGKRIPVGSSRSVALGMKPILLENSRR